MTPVATHWPGPSSSKQIGSRNPGTPVSVRICFMYKNFTLLAVLIRVFKVSISLALGLVKQKNCKNINSDNFSLLVISTASPLCRES